MGNCRASCVDHDMRTVVEGLGLSFGIFLLFLLFKGCLSVFVSRRGIKSLSYLPPFMM